MFLVYSNKSWGYDGYQVRHHAVCSTEKQAQGLVNVLKQHELKDSFDDSIVNYQYCEVGTPDACTALDMHNSYNLESRLDDVIPEIVKSMCMKWYSDLLKAHDFNSEAFESVFKPMTDEDKFNEVMNLVKMNTTAMSIYCTDREKFSTLLLSEIAEKWCN